MQHRHGELKSLLDPERQALGFCVSDVCQIVAFQKLLDAAPDLSGRQVVKLSVQIEILPDGKFAVEGECLRHVTDIATHLHVV